MKKGLVLGLAGLFLLTGCGKVKCTNGNDTYVGKFKNDNISEMTITEKFKSKDEAKEYCTTIKAMKSIYGEGTKVKCSSKKVSVTVKAPKGTKMTKKEFKDSYCKK